MLASAPSLPKFVRESAAMYYELRKRGTSSLAPAQNFGRAVPIAIAPALHCGCARSFPVLLLVAVAQGEGAMVAHRAWLIALVSSALLSGCAGPGAVSGLGAAGVGAPPSAERPGTRVTLRNPD